MFSAHAHKLRGRCTYTLQFSDQPYDHECSADAKCALGMHICVLRAQVNYIAFVHMYYFENTDPYVKVYMLHKHRRLDKWKSTTKKNTLSPVFNEPFEFDMTGMDMRDVCLEIFIMDHDRFRKNDVIGIVYVGLHVPSDSGTSHFNEVLSNLGQQISHWHHLIPHQQLKKRKRHKSNTM